MFRQRIITSLVFSCAGILPAQIALIVLFRGNLEVAINFFIRHQEAHFGLIFLPMVAGCISGFVLGERVCREKYDKTYFKHCIGMSIPVALLALTVWSLFVSFGAQSHEQWVGFKLALAGATVFGWAVYPPALIAGFCVWKLTKPNNDSLSDHFSVVPASQKKNAAN